MPKETNVLPIWGNRESMNLNPLILTNIQSSQYFKVNLYELKTYHEVIDEIFYQVRHLEPWEKGSRKTQGLTGMCGGVRGVGGGGIVSTAYCILYKLYTLKLTRKQVIGLITHQDSPYIRALGFMYIRYTQPPSDLFSWYADYLNDTEDMDVKAGGGCIMSIGQMLRQWLIRIEWFDTLFPRIPVPSQKEIMDKLKKHGVYKDDLENSTREHEEFDRNSLSTNLTSTAVPEMPETFGIVLPSTITSTAATNDISTNQTKKRLSSSVEQNGNNHSSDSSKKKLHKSRSRSPRHHHRHHHHSHHKSSSHRDRSRQRDERAKGTSGEEHDSRRHHHTHSHRRHHHHRSVDDGGSSNNNEVEKYRHSSKRDRS